MQILHYELLECLYQGSRSHIFRAKDTKTNQSVILKTPPEEVPDQETLHRFQHDFTINQRIDSPHILSYQALERYNHSLALIEEDFNALSLAAFLPKTGVPLLDFFKVALPLAEALMAVHQHKVTHTNLTPHNVLINSQNNTVKLSDFSKALVWEEKDNYVLESPQLEEAIYLSPEQTGRTGHTIDYRTDLYSLGILYYQTLCGKVPFSSNDVGELIHYHLAAVPPPPHETNTAIPQVLSKIVMRLLEKSPDDRYQSAYGLQKDLEQCLQEIQTSGLISTFPLGMQDISGKFQLSNTLYGREKEIQCLLGVLKEANEGTRGIVLVSGPSGIGKSTLIQKVVSQHSFGQGYFISGKFDPASQNVAYHGLIESFTSLIKQVLSESKKDIERWRKKLSSALGENAQVLINVIKDLELILGPQKGLPNLGPSESKNLLNILFQNLVQVFTSLEHGLVLFLDDLQWADSASLSVLQSIMNGSTNENLVWIGAYRDNEITDSHSFKEILTSLEQSKHSIHKIPLSPLDQNHIDQFIADTLHSTPKKTLPLTKLMLRKAGGNPFFITEFLKSLYQTNLVSFNPQSGWEWDLEQITSLEISDNVVSFLTEKMKRLPQQTQSILATLGCLRSTFSSAIFAYLFDETFEAASQHLSQLVEVEILVRLKDHYKFAHDKIQETAYSLMNDSQKQNTHYYIGQALLLYSQKNGQLDDFIFEIAYQLNRGKGVIKKAKDRDQVAQLNLQAGQKARNTAAFVQAEHFFEKGLDLLQDDIWESHHCLAFSLHLAKAECEYINGHFQKVEHHLPFLLAHAKSKQEKTEVYRLKIKLKIHQQQRGLSLQVLQAALKLFDIDFPSTPDELNEELEKEIEAIHRYYKNHPDFSLIDLPEMTHPDMLCVMNLLSDAIVALYYQSPKYFFYSNAKMTNLSFHFGNSVASPTAYIGYAILYYGTENHSIGKRLVEQAIEIRKKKSDTSEWIKGQYFLINLNAFLLEPLNVCSSRFLDLHHFSYQHGNFFYAGISMALYLITSYIKGDSLEEVYAKHAKGKEIFETINESYLLHTFQWEFQFIRALMGRTSDLTHLSDDNHDESKGWEELIRTGHHNAMFRWGFFKEILLYHAEEYDAAAEMAAMAEENVSFQEGLLIATEHFFFHALILLEVGRTCSEARRVSYLKFIIRDQEKLNNWANFCPNNFQHKKLFLDAEWAWFQGKFQDVPGLFAQTIEQAHQDGFIHIAALAYERAAKFYREQQQLTIAQMYLSYAIQSYQRWGASAKVEFLIQHHQDWFLWATTPQVSWDTRPSELHQSSLDVTTVTKASQAISEEIVLDRLLERLMTILLAHAGAQRGGLLLEDQGHFILKIMGALENQKVTTTSPRFSNRAQHMPESVLRYVERTHEELVLRDIQEDARFTQDAYVKTAHPRSVLCLPILLQKKLIALLYLENNLIVGAFTPNHLQLLQLLSSQTAISIENARLYESQQQHLQRMQELDQLKDEFLANTSHELRTPLAGIIGLSQSLLDGIGGKPNEAQAQHLKLIAQSGQRLMHLINDIQDLSRLKNRDLALNIQPIDLKSIVELILNICHPLIGKKDLLLVSTIPEDLPAVSADENRLQQILFNLLGNAIKFTKKGKVEIKVEIGGQQVHVHVNDSGIGIAPNKLNRIFNAFEQADGSLSRGFEGTGLGLYLTKQLVELHQGTLTVQSSEGLGSCFTFSLPLFDSSHFLNSADWQTSTKFNPPLNNLSSQTNTPFSDLGFSPPPPSMVPIEQAGIPLSVHLLDKENRTHILVVDDDPINLQVLVNILTQQGYIVTTAINGLEALELLKLDGGVTDTGFELVLLDVMMPEMNGYEVCRTIRSTRDATDLPIILLTARTQPDDLVIGLKAGANDYLTKPMVKEELLARIENHLQLKQSVRRLKENERLREVLFQKEKIAEDALTEKRRLIRLLDQAGASHSLSERDTTLLREVRHLPEALDTKSDSDQKAGNETEGRQILVSLMSLALRYWTQTTHQTKVDLAEASQIWNIYFDTNGSPRTRTLDRYLKLSTLPKKPRWRDVLQTVYYVIATCPNTAPDLKTQLEVQATELERLLQ